jgi:uncharacterized membrane protein YcaP (DUF421 family)
LNQIFFSSWEDLLRTAILGVLGYTSLVFLLRISGRRTLSKMNAFDMVITVALGSTLATVLLNKNITLAEGALGFALLIGMQFVVTWFSVRTSWVRNLVTGEPALLFYEDRMLRDAMRKARVTENELHAAVRAAALPSVEQVHAVVLETDGSFSVIKKASGNDSSLAGVKVPGQ